MALGAQPLESTSSDGLAMWLPRNPLAGGVLAGVGVGMDLAEGRAMTVGHEETRSGGTLRALVLHDRPLVVDLIELTLNHGLFLVRAARSLAEANTILSEWQPHLAVVDMDHDDSSAMLERVGASNTPDAQRHAGPGSHPPRRPQDEAAGLRARGRRHPRGALLARGAAGALRRHHASRQRHRATHRAHHPPGRDRIDIVDRQVRAGDTVVHLSASSRACSTSWPAAAGRS